MNHASDLRKVFCTRLLLNDVDSRTEVWSQFMEGAYFLISLGTQGLVALLFFGFLLIFPREGENLLQKIRSKYKHVTRTGT